MKAEMVSSRILLPIITERLNAAKTHIPYINGRALVFNQGEERQNRVRIIEADGRIYDKVLPEGLSNSLYRTFRSSESNPLILIQWGALPMEQSKEDWGYEYRFIEIEIDGNVRSEAVRLKKIRRILCVSDNLFTADGEGSRGLGDTKPVAALLRDKEIFDLLIKSERGISDAVIIGDKIICTFGGGGKRDLLMYSLVDNTTRTIGSIIDKYPFPYGWAFDGQSVLAWSDRRDELRDKDGQPVGIYDIHYYNFSRKQGGVLLTGNSNKEFPFLYGDYLFWSDDRNKKKSGYDIYAKNLKTGAEKLLVEGPDDQLYPVYFGGYLYWSNKTTSVLTTLLRIEGQNYVFRKKVELP